MVLGARREECLKEAAEAMKAKGLSVSYVACDVRDGASLSKAMDYCVDTFGGLDVVVANAGVEGAVRQGLTLETAPDDELTFVADVNLAGVLKTIKYAIPKLRTGGGGTVFVASSMSSCLNGRRMFQGNQMLGSDQFSMFIPYAATKAACDHVVRLCSGAYKKDKIDVIGLNYCSFKSEMMDRDKNRLALHTRGNPYFRKDLGDPKSISNVVK